jgi:flavodoxin I
MKKIGIFYAPAKGSTEKVVKMLANKLGNNADVHFIDDNSDANILDAYDNIIFGISTVGRDHWDAQYTKVGWDHFLAKIAHYDFSNKTIAIAALGNHIMYEDNFLDALGHLAPLITKSGGKIIGEVEVSKFEDFEHIDSFGVIDGKFPGLPIDEDNLSDVTEERLNNWLAEIKPQFA